MGTRLGAKARVSERWKAALKTLASRSEEDEMTASLRDQIEKETGATLTGLRDADAAAKKAATLMNGLKAAANKDGEKSETAGGEAPEKEAGDDDKSDKSDKSDKAAAAAGRDATGGKQAADEPAARAKADAKRGGG